MHDNDPDEKMARLLASNNPLLLAGKPAISTDSEILAGSALPHHFKSDITIPVSQFQTQLDATAQLLLGMTLCRRLNGSILRARIVEVEVYDQFDPTSHCYPGFTMRNRAMFSSALHAYIYVSHGIHYCMNVSLGPKCIGAGALIRAVEPVEGREMMENLRHKTGYDVSNGPAKLCQALQITDELYGVDLTNPTSPLFLENSPASPSVPADSRIAATRRIGISKNTEALRRFILADNPYVSRFH